MPLVSQLLGRGEAMGMLPYLCKALILGEDLQRGSLAVGTE